MVRRRETKSKANGEAHLRRDDLPPPSEDKEQRMEGKRRQSVMRASNARGPPEVERHREQRA